MTLRVDSNGFVGDGPSPSILLYISLSDTFILFGVLGGPSTASVAEVVDGSFLNLSIPSSTRCCRALGLAR